MISAVRISTKNACRSGTADVRRTYASSAASVRYMITTGVGRAAIIQSSKAIPEVPTNGVPVLRKRTWRFRTSRMPAGMGPQVCRRHVRQVWRTSADFRELVVRRVHRLQQLHGVSGAMTNCKFCHQEELDGQVLSDKGGHMTCRNEYVRRLEYYLCVKCGENLCEPSVCQSCEDQNNEYAGYPGP